MKRVVKILIVFVVLSGIGVMGFADRAGFIKKDKPRMNIKNHGTLKNSVRYNLTAGLKYDGSKVMSVKKVGNSFVAESVISYRKGNTIYLIPYKQRIAIPQYSKEDGYRLVLRSKNK